MKWRRRRRWPVRENLEGTTRIYSETHTHTLTHVCIHYDGGKKWMRNTTQWQMSKRTRYSQGTYAHTLTCIHAMAVCTLAIYTPCIKSTNFRYRIQPPNHETENDSVRNLTNIVLCNVSESEILISKKYSLINLIPIPIKMIHRNSKIEIMEAIKVKSAVVRYLVAFLWK